MQVYMCQKSAKLKTIRWTVYCHTSFKSVAFKVVTNCTLAYVFDNRAVDVWHSYEHLF